MNLNECLRGVYLNDVGGQLGRPVLQVMSVDGEHTVIAAEPPVLCGQSPFQQVKNKNTWLVSPSHEFNAQLFPRVPLVKNHMEHFFSWRATFRMRVCSVAKAPLPKHREMQRAAGLGKDGSGIVMGHIADVTIVNLEKKNYDLGMTIFYLPNL